MDTVRERLERGLTALGLSDEQCVAALLAYVDLLNRWNRAYNLSAVRDPLDMVTRHVLDSLVVRPYLRGERLLDVGSGAGLPGIPLAIADPSRPVTLLDTNGKKTRFLRQAVFELRLANVEVVQARIEHWRAAQGFDTVISRAYTETARFWRQVRELLCHGGAALAMKGRQPAEELAELAAEDVSWRSHRLEVPGLEAERHLIVLEPAYKA